MVGYGDLGCCGQKVIQTPHIDKLAQAGIRFTNVYARAPVCAPFRSVVMTDQHTGHTHIRENSLDRLSFLACEEERKGYGIRFRKILDK